MYVCRRGGWKLHVIAPIEMSPTVHCRCSINLFAYPHKFSLSVLLPHSLGKKCNVSLFSFIVENLVNCQGDHDKSHTSSSCQQPRYVSNKSKITNPGAAAAYEKTLKSTLIYKNADSLCRVCCLI